MSNSTRVHVVAALALLSACGQAMLTPSLAPPGQAPAIGPADTLKVHMRSGELYMLRNWSLDSAARVVNGNGVHYTVRRDSAPVSPASIALDSVALFETNRHGAAYPFGMQGVGVMTTLGAYVSTICLMDPKACFGSCPTFYVEGDTPDRVQAEGFSSSVARVLEDRDVDALPAPGARGKTFRLRMKNEAWETHMVRSVNLLVAERPRGGRVFAGTDSAYYAVTNIASPTRCSANEGDCLNQIRQLDQVERRSEADSQNLATREWMELTLPAPKGRPALVLSARNSLITTFLFYQSMAYVGDGMGAMIAAFERGGRAYAESHFGMARLLGAIQVEVHDGTDWRPVGTFGEHGPIAADTKAIPLPAAQSDSMRLRLGMAKGNWRVDWVAIGEITGTATPHRIQPARVERDGKRDDAALATLLDTARTLVSMPGDDFRITYRLPESAERLELFLESQGWYYEWQRTEWLAEKDGRMAALVLLDPAKALQVLAPAYKSREGHMEELFWASRFNRASGGAR